MSRAAGGSPTRKAATAPRWEETTAWFSQPACDRMIYRMIRKFKIRSILEIGMGSGKRAENMIQLCHRYGAGTSVRYSGIDLFEERPVDRRHPDL